MKPKDSGRRSFLKNGAALAGLAVGAVQTARAGDVPDEKSGAPAKDLHGYGERSRFETSERLGAMGLYDPAPPGYHRDFGWRNPIQDSVGYITPASLHFVIAHGYEPPDIDPAEHHLLIHGLVDKPLIFSMDDLKRFPSVTRAHFLECNANGAPAGPTGQYRVSPNATAQDTHGFTSCSLWTGVPLSILLKHVGVKPEAKWIIGEGSEKGKHTKSIPIEKAMDDVLIAYGQNGEALRPQQGYPIRLLVPGWEGINNVKWLRKIKLVEEPYMGMWESTKYPSLRPDGLSRWFQFQMGPRTVITRPSGGQKLNGPGFYEISGLAWSGGGVVKSIEVSTDNGKSWREAEIQSPVYPKAHVRFGFGWDWNGEETILQSRCTDETGERQPTVVELAKFWKVEPDFFIKTGTIPGHFNAIQPWKVNPDGSVQNAISF
ncbi:MAG TPA: sulfite dehydrogenase [Verrucomicrobiae bacterium]|jgi:sulfane dehydrogenase subunit SoxC|nr:sulfite dehydrogenase [Verrucomicrobiae bacterium]